MCMIVPQEEITGVSISSSEDQKLRSPLDLENVPEMPKIFIGVACYLADGDFCCIVLQSCIVSAGNGCISVSWSYVKYHLGVSFHSCIDGLSPRR